MKTEQNPLAPIVLFAYNRPSQTAKTLAALAENVFADNSILYIYCDGPKKNASIEELSNIQSVLHIANNAVGFKNVIVKQQSENKGLANSIINGVTEICDEYGFAIILEDDIVTSSFFLQYMNDALQLYKNVDAVACVSGYCYPIKEQLHQTFFLKNQSCWGWATWARAWTEFEHDGTKLLLQLQKKKLKKKFDLEGSIKYTQMLKDQIIGKNNSWAIRWDAVNFINDKLCLYPNVSLVQNIGFDGSGVHSAETNYYKVHLSDHPIIVSLIPLIESYTARNSLIRFYKKNKKSIFIKFIYGIIYKLKLDKSYKSL